MRGCVHVMRACVHVHACVGVCSVFVSGDLGNFKRKLRPAGCSKILQKIQVGQRKTQGIFGIFWGPPTGCVHMQACVGGCICTHAWECACACACMSVCMCMHACAHVVGHMFVHEMCGGSRNPVYYHNRQTLQPPVQSPVQPPAAILQPPVQPHRGMAFLVCCSPVSAQCGTVQQSCTLVHAGAGRGGVCRPVNHCSQHSSVMACYCHCYCCYCVPIHPEPSNTPHPPRSASQQCLPDI